MERKKQNRDTLASINALYDGKEMVLNFFKSGKFPLKPKEGTERPGMLPLSPSALALVAKVSGRMLKY